MNNEQALPSTFTDEGLLSDDNYRIADAHLAGALKVSKQTAGTKRIWMFGFLPIVVVALFWRLWLGTAADHAISYSILVVLEMVTLLLVFISHGRSRRLERRLNRLPGLKLNAGSDRSIEQAGVQDIGRMLVVGLILCRFDHQASLELLHSLAVRLDELLRTVRAEDGVTLTSRQIMVLNTLALTGDSNIRSKLAIPKGSAIMALGVLGDRSSVQQLRRLAVQPACSAADRDAINAAILQIEARLSAGSETMLRASDSPDIPDKLLRAGIKSGQDQAEELLRGTGE